MTRYAVPNGESTRERLPKTIHEHAEDGPVPGNEQEDAVHRIVGGVGSPHDDAWLDLPDGGRDSAQLCVRWLGPEKADNNTSHDLPEQAELRSDSETSSHHRNLPLKSELLTEYAVFFIGGGKLPR